MSEQNEALIRRWFDEVWNRRREEAIDEMMADDVSALGLPPSPISGREAFKQFYRPFIAAFPEFSITVEEVFSREDRLAFRCRVRGTHRNGRSCDFQGGGFVLVRDGKLAEGHNVWNFLEMMEQLELLPADTLSTVFSDGTPE